MCVCVESGGGEGVWAEGGCPGGVVVLDEVEKKGE